MTEEMLWLELCLDAGLSYDEYISQPMWLIEAHMERIVAKARKG